MSMSLEKTVANLMQKMERHFYGKYRGFVVDNEDPEQVGRLKLQVPSVLGNEVVTGWAMPCVPYGGDANQGMLFIPETGAGVWVEFEEGDLEFPIWTGTFWSKPDGESELPKPNDADGAEQSDVQSPHSRKIIKTVKGHTIQFEDKDGEESIIINEASNNHVVTLNADGIKITDGANTQEITMDANGITILDQSNNQVQMHNQGINCEDANGNSLVLDASSGFPAGPGIKVNGEKRVCLEDLITWLLSHQHVGNMGAPTPLHPANMSDLITAMAGGNSILSTKVKAG